MHSSARATWGCASGSKNLSGGARCAPARIPRGGLIDDRVENVAAAASLGIHGVRYEGSEQLTGELVRLGILPVLGPISRVEVQEA